MADQRDQLIELIDEKWLNTEEVIVACLKYMSLDEVQDMMEVNEYDTLFQDYTAWTED
jgi:hypothetical protein